MKKKKNSVVLVIVFSIVAMIICILMGFFIKRMLILNKQSNVDVNDKVKSYLDNGYQHLSLNNTNQFFTKLEFVENKDYVFAYLSDNSNIKIELKKIGTKAYFDYNGKQSAISVDNVSQLLVVSAGCSVNSEMIYVVTNDGKIFMSRADGVVLVSNVDDVIYNYNNSFTLVNSDISKYEEVSILNTKLFSTCGTTTALVGKIGNDWYDIDTNEKYENNEYNDIYLFFDSKPYYINRTGDLEYFNYALEKYVSMNIVVSSYIQTTSECYIISKEGKLYKLSGSTVSLVRNSKIEKVLHKRQNLKNNYAIIFENGEFVEINEA